MALTTTQVAILTAISTAATAAGSVAQGRAASAQGKLQAEMYERQAQRERQIGELNAAREAKRNRAIQAQQRALLAGTGADPSSGSALLIQTDLAEEGKLNEELIRNNADAAVTTSKTQAVFARAEGKNAQRASYFRAGSALLKGAAEFG